MITTVAFTPKWSQYLVCVPRLCCVSDAIRPASVYVARTLPPPVPRLYSNNKWTKPNTAPTWLLVQLLFSFARTGIVYVGTVPQQAHEMYDMGDGLEMHRLLLVTIGIVERSGNQLRDQSHFPDAATTLPVFNPCHRSSPSTEQQPSPLTLVCIPSFWPGKLISHYDESVMWLALCLLSIRPMPLVRRRPSPCSCIRRSSFSNLTSTATIDEARRFD